MDAQEFELYMRMLEFKQANLLILSDIANKWSSVVWPMWTFIVVFLGFIGSIIAYQFAEKEHAKNILTVVSLVLGLASLLSAGVWSDFATTDAHEVLVSFARN
jgi:hypothetical protein